MRRAELARGIQEINDALEASGLQNIFSTLLLQREQTGEPAFREKLLKALKEYAIRARTFSPTAHRLAEQLGMEALEEPGTWIRLLGEVDLRFVRLHHERMRMISEYLPAVAALLQQPPAAAEHALPYDGAHLLTVLVVERDGQQSSPQRLRSVFESIEQLYETCATVLGLHPEPLVVAGCDAGRDKAFEFLGSPRAIEAIKELILELWDRVVFFRAQELPDRIQQAAASLSILDRIDALRAQGALSPEHAEVLRRGVRGSVTRFLKAGAMIPELEAHAQFDPRVLMAPEPKLLSQGGAPAAPAGHTAHESASAPSPEAPAQQVAPAEERAAADAKPWQITSEVAATDRAQPPAESPGTAGRSGFKNRVAYLLDEIKAASSKQPAEDPS